MPDNYVTAITDAPPSPTPSTLQPAVAQDVSPANALGSRDTAVPAQINVPLLLQAVHTPTVLVTNGSPGVSPILRELLLESGVQFAAVRELYNDSATHQAGNALDITADDLTAVADFVRAVPTLFGQVAWSNPAHGQEYCYIRNGQTVSPFTVDNDASTMHLSSSFAILRAGLSNRSVVAALQAGVWTGQFGNRDVYAVSTGELSAALDEQGVRFW